MTIPTQADLERLAEQVGKLLVAHGKTLATAESCTGGWVAQCLTAIAGSSAWLDRGFVTYSNASKEDMLGVPNQTLMAHGAVSEQTAQAMAEGALAHSKADYAIAITGIAGPSGGSVDKPVGTVCFAVSQKDGISQTSTRHFSGDRTSVRAQSVGFILQQITRIA